MASRSAKECPICYEEYDEEEWCPRVLACAHTLCTKCIKNLISRNSKNCPFCIREFEASTSRDVGVNTSLLDALKLIRETELLVPSPCVREDGKDSNWVSDLKRETDKVINKLIDSVQKADDEIDRNLHSNEELENSLIHANEIIRDMLTENFKRIEYLKEQSRRLKGHKMSISETRNVLKTAKKKLAVGSFMQIAEVAGDVESSKTDTETHLSNLMVHMAEDEKTHLKLEKTVNLTRDPIEKLGKIVKASEMDNEDHFTPDIHHLKIRDAIPQATTIESLHSRSLSVMVLIKQGHLFGVQQLEMKKRYTQITLDEQNRICLHSIKEENIPSKAHLLKDSDILKLLDVSSKLVLLEPNLDESVTQNMEQEQLLEKIKFLNVAFREKDEKIKFLNVALREKDEKIKGLEIECKGLQNILNSTTELVERLIFDRR